jgi:hypothetical protein
MGKIGMTNPLVGPWEIQLTSKAIRPVPPTHLRSIVNVPVKKTFMATKKKPNPAEELARQERIKKLGIIAIFSDDLLLERLVLKGGNALDLIHHVSARASVDIDLSMDGDFTSGELPDLGKRIEKALQETFRPEGFEVFDVRLEMRPPTVTADLRDFWGGYGVEFKLIESDRYKELAEDIEALRRNAVPLGQGTKFSIEISKYEYTAGKVQFDLDGYAIFVYTPAMIICEKLRAICQQMKEYGQVVKRNRPGSARARDFIDIERVIGTCSVDPTKEENRTLLTSVFAAKRVKLSLLRNVETYREFHRQNYDAVVAAVKPGVTLKEFDYYVDFVLELIERLEPLGDE